VTARYLLDTNVLSEPLKPAPDAQLMDRLQLHHDRIATAAVVWHELVYGCARLPRSKRRSLIESYLRQVVAATLQILPYDQQAASWHAAERARLSQQGLAPPFAAGQIAAIAVTQDLTLVTRNIRDYQHFDGLRRECWQQP
jgi:tRNA(fMet)-specific endonuclease VapC